MKIGVNRWGFNENENIFEFNMTDKDTDEMITHSVTAECLWCIFKNKQEELKKKEENMR